MRRIMKGRSDMRRHLGKIGAVALAVSLVGGAAIAETPREDVRWRGMTRAGSVLLPNGWSLKPAGRQAPLGDFPVLVAEHPAEPILAVLHAGYGEHEVVTLNATDGKVIGRVAV